ncbi:MAG: type I methionyl aminopeptidase [Desulfobacterales bacterium]|jgi:methionyl aminopeptidase
MKQKKKTGKIGRNQLCPCGSRKKYKNCCMDRPGKPPEPIAQVYLKKYNIRLKTPEEIVKIRRAGELVMATFREVETLLAPGITTEAIDTLVHEYTLAHNATPAPLDYRGFPKSVCVSVNEVICHGIPGERILAEGDIVNVDITSILDGFYADANQTYFIGPPAPEARKIVDVARNCLKEGLNMVKPGHTVGDIGWAIQHYAESRNCSVVREFVGHGVGLAFHEAPQIPHFGKRHTGTPLVPGMVFTIEPMINLGGRELRILPDKWTAVTADGSLSAQFEQTVLVTDGGYESMTPFEL